MLLRDDLRSLLSKRIHTFCHLPRQIVRCVYTQRGAKGCFASTLISVPPRENIGTMLEQGGLVCLAWNSMMRLSAHGFPPFG